MGLLSWALPCYLPSTFWLPGSPIFCLATNCLTSTIVMSGPNIVRTEREKSFGWWLLLLPPQNCLGPGARENWGRGEGGSSTLSELFEVSFPIPQAWLLLGLSRVPHLWGLGVLSSRWSVLEGERRWCFGFSVLPQSASVVYSSVFWKSCPVHSVQVLHGKGGMCFLCLSQN